MALCLLSTIEEACQWFASRGVSRLVSDSRSVQPGDGFIAWSGIGKDRRLFVQTALDAGAAACLVEAEGVEPFHFDDERVAALVGLKAAGGPLAANYLKQPSRELSLMAVTGTNGKSSTAWWTAQALTALGRHCGFIGTLGVGVPPVGQTPMAIDATGFTTPDPVMLQAALRRFIGAGLQACAIEASSIGIAERRLDGASIHTALFTNFTRDHLDYHGSMESYWQVKDSLFDWPGLKAAVVNIDDEHGHALALRLAAGGLELWTYSTLIDARLRASDIGYVDDGLSFTLHEGDASVVVHTRLIGSYNVSNALAVIGGLRSVGVALEDAARICTLLTPVPGRMQRVLVDGTGPQVVVDYAHTPDALEKALLALQPFAKARGGQLWCVFGCGGDRDATKRPLMGALAQAMSDHAVVTSDNPRHESPSNILQMIVAGMTGTKQPEVIEDRRAAIGYAIQAAANDDVVILAGKGHEDYQDIGGQKLPFSDIEEANLALQRRQGMAA